MNKYKITIPKQMKFFIALVFILVVAFTIWTDSGYFLYLLWNIFLAFLPFLISSSLLWYKDKEKTYKFIFLIGLFFWLILFPNTPYLITDLIHIGENSAVPFLLDIVLLSVCAYIGVYLTILSLFQIEKSVSSYFSIKKTNFIILSLIFLSSFGIYLGRFLRWNSWDIFIQPKFILNDVLDIFMTPKNHNEAYFTTILFFVFISISYYFWKYFFKNKIML